MSKTIYKLLVDDIKYLLYIYLKGLTICLLQYYYYEILTVKNV